MGCCAGKLQFHKETKRQDKNEYQVTFDMVYADNVRSA